MGGHPTVVGGIFAGSSGRRKAEAERLESIGHIFSHHKLEWFKHIPSVV